VDAVLPLLPPAAVAGLDELTDLLGLGNAVVLSGAGLSTEKRASYPIEIWPLGGSA
jgi:hypothetical protein